MVNAGRPVTGLRYDGPRLQVEAVEVLPDGSIGGGVGS